ncbi:hypothetical protein [Crocosphaera sp.]|uniref:hypothetical protein n=1 Tax=Crocosphaera sp. TaxID=2729996 RepID=UPI00260365A1|nr:hypothetical protein [Crocosphaera sp.]MDJ0581370.1 hypothetical protein [Crocosphaera sp.]
MTNTISFLVSNFVKTLSLSASLTLLLNNNQLAKSMTFVDTLEDIGVNGTVVNSRTIGDVEVNISTRNNRDIFAKTYFDNSTIAFAFVGANGQSNAPFNPANVSGSHFISTVLTGDVNSFFDQVKPITFSFSEPILGFGLTTIDLLEPGVTSNNFLSLSVFDASNNLIDSQIRTGSQGSSGIDLDWFVSSENANIVSATLSGNISNSAGYGIDDIVVITNDSAESIPESSNLFGIVFIALLGLASWTYYRRDK